MADTIELPEDDKYEENKPSGEKSRFEVFEQHFKESEILKQTINPYIRNRRFALNSSSAERLMNSNIINLRRLNIKESLVANTLESYKSRILSDSHDITNDIVAQDNYEYFLLNSKLIGKNLAKLILAKAEKDRDLEKSLEDILDPNGAYSKMSPDLIIKEVYNRLKERNLYNIPELKTLIKVLKGIDKIEKKEQHYQDTINKKRDEIVDKLVKGYAGEIFPNVDVNQPLAIEYENILKSLNNMFDEVKPRENEKLINYMDRVKEEIAQGNKLIQDDYIEFEKIININEDLYYLYDMNASDLENKVIRARGLFKDETVKSFYAKDKEAKERAYLLSSSLVLENQESARSILLYFLDDDLYNEIKTDRTLDRYISQAVDILDINKERAEKLFENIRDIVKNNEDVLKSLVIPEGQEKYNPLTFTLADKKNDVSLKILENITSLAIFKNENNELFGNIYTKEAQNALIESLSDPSISKKRAGIDEVNDIFNTYLLLQKSATSEIDTNDIDQVCDVVFKDNSFLSNEDKENLNRFSKDLSKDSQKIFSDIKAGVPTQDELSFAIQEMAYLDIANKQAKKLEFSLTNVGRFFRNNRAIHKFTNCMEVAKNPSNNVETTPSMSKDCLEKLKNELEQDAQNAQEMVSRMGVFAGFNPFTALVMINEVLSKAQVDDINREIIKATQKISEQISYVERSSNNLQKLARQMIVESDYSGASDSYVDKSVATALADRIEREALAKDIASNKDIALEGEFKAKFDNIKIDLSNIDINNSRKELIKLKDYRDNLYEKAIDKIALGSSAKDINNEISRVNRVIFTLQKNILSDNEILKKIVENKLRSKGVDISEDIKSKIKKDGLTTEVLNRVIQTISDIDTKRDVVLSLETVANIQKLLKEDGNIIIPNSDRSANIATYIAYLKDADSELAKEIVSANRQYVTVDIVGQRGYLQTGKDLDGYVLKEMDKEYKKLINGQEIDNERLKKLHSLNIDTNTNLLSKQAKDYLEKKNQSIEKLNRERLRSVQQKRRETTLR